MSLFAPYAFTGAVSLYLGYKTYSSYYSNLDFEEINQEDVQMSEEKILDEKKSNSEIIEPLTKDELVREGKKKGEEIKVIIEEVKDEIGDIKYESVEDVVNRTLEKVENTKSDSESSVVLSQEIPDTVFPEVENLVTKTTPKKKKNKKKRKKRN